MDAANVATFAGNITIPIGSTSAPSLNFSGFTDTGLSKGTYDTTKDQIQFSVDGSHKARIFEAGVESYANLYFNGDVRTFGTLWHATAGTSGVGFRFENTHTDTNNVVALDLSATGDATFAGDINTSGELTINNAVNNNNLGIHIKNDNNLYSGALTFWTEYSGTDTHTARVQAGTDGTDAAL